MGKFDDNKFFIEKNNKVYKYINGQKRLITLLKPNYSSVYFNITCGENENIENIKPMYDAYLFKRNVDLDEKYILDMEDTNNLINADLIKYILDNSTYTIKDIDIEPHLIRQIVDGLDLYAIDISKIWGFHNYDGNVDIIYYSSIDKETNQLIY